MCSGNRPCDDSANAALTVCAYAKKYGIPESTVYNSLYSGRIKGKKGDHGWMVDDVPPPMYKSKAKSVKIEALDDYDLALIWLNGTIIDNAVLLRSMDEFVPSYFAKKFGCTSWRKQGGTFVCKISSKALVHILRKRGFTGRKDIALAAPDIDDAAFAAAFIESRASLVRQLRYARRHARDKAYAYYVPAIAMCASYPIMESAVEALHNLGIIPRRKLYPAANRSSATLKITSRTQLNAIHNVLHAYGENAAFWETLSGHIQSPHQPYYRPTQ